MLHLVIENLPCELAGLFEDHASVLCVSVVAKVRPLVDEALPLRIEHDAERITMLLEAVADREIAELGCVAIPSHRMASRPVPVRHRANVERHANSIAGVEARAAHLREIPIRPEITRTPFRIRLEAAAREDHR